MTKFNKVNNVNAAEKKAPESKQANPVAFGLAYGISTMVGIYLGTYLCTKVVPTIVEGGKQVFNAGKEKLSENYCKMKERKHQHDPEEDYDNLEEEEPFNYDFFDDDDEETPTSEPESEETVEEETPEYVQEEETSEESEEEKDSSEEA